MFDRNKKIRVLVIDDSLFMRQMISDILNDDPDIEVLDTAISGEEGLTKLEKLNPDVITLDYEMPGLDGVATLKKIMRMRFVPVIMISAHTREGGEITLEALAQGAVDFVLKPSGTVSLDIKTIKDEIVKKVKIAAGANIKAVSLQLLYNRGKKEVESVKGANYKLQANKVVAIGSSTGGTKGVELILEALPAKFPAPILIVQHMPEMFTALFADRLNRLAKITVKEGESSEEVKAGIAYIAPGGWHMTVKLDDSFELLAVRGKNEDESLKAESYKLKAKLVLTKEAPIYGLRPAVDVLLNSVAEVYGANAIGVILSGMGSDGTKGLDAIFKSGGKTIAQDEKTSVVFGMPKRAIESGAVDEVLPINKIASRILELITA
jgi:two-component system, chemotaxis family, protein-glutamate methylesterase/glutaminase